MVLQDNATILYKKLHAVIYSRAKHLQTTLRENCALERLPYLTLLLQIWSEYLQRLSTIRSVFLYLDQTFALHTPKIYQIHKLALIVFEAETLVPETKHKIYDCILSLIQSERDSLIRHLTSYDEITTNSLNQSLFPLPGISLEFTEIIISVVKIFTALGLYEDFEARYFSASKTYFSSESARFAVLPPDDFFSSIAIRIATERLRVSNETLVQLSTGYPSLAQNKGYFSVHTTQSTVDLIYSEYIFSTLERVEMVLGVVGEYVKLKKYEKVKILYNIFLVNRRGDEVVRCIAATVKDLGIAVIKTEKIEDLVKFKTEVDEMVKVLGPEVEVEAGMGVGVDRISDTDASAAHTLLIKIVKEAFVGFVNMKVGKASIEERLSKYLDGVLKVKDEEDHVESVLTKCLAIFRFVKGKDLFEAYYKKDLSKRLLLSKSSSYDSEKSMIQKLAVECGSGFTQKLEGMFKDMEISKETMNDFKAALTTKPPFEIYVNVLTTAYWPTFPQFTVTLPHEMTRMVESFKTFYHSKHKGRRLTWQHNLGYCSLKAWFPKGAKELSLSFIQALILLQFNTSPEYTVSDLSTITDIPIPEIIRTVVSMAYGKHKLLIVENKNTGASGSGGSSSGSGSGSGGAGSGSVGGLKVASVSGESTVKINELFKSPNVKLKISAIQGKLPSLDAKPSSSTTSGNVSVSGGVGSNQQDDEEDEVDEADEDIERARIQKSVVIERSNLLDCFLVRVMKMRRRVGVVELFREVRDGMRFGVSGREIKERVERFIGGNYIEREENDINVLKYVA
ncbi:Cullin-4 [Nowakowskiella sp. JEL0407]|nr:Cullin-4 [Nowakowskiella sp. JEL0407]